MNDLDTSDRSRWLAPLLLVVIGLALPTGYLAWRGLLPGGGGHQGASAGTDGADPAAETGQMLEELRPVASVVLYFSDAGGERLVPEMRDVADTDDRGSRAAAIVRELAAGSTQGYARTIPPGVDVRHVFIDDAEIVYLDLSADLVERHPGGTRGEVLTIRSLARSILANDPRATGVRLLVEGRQPSSLLGHVDVLDELRGVDGSG